MSRNIKPDFYRILGVSHDAEAVVIRAAYRALIQRYHPDKVEDQDKAKAQVRIQAIQEAYRVLSDPIRKSEFDRTYHEQAGKRGLVATKTTWEMPKQRFSNPLDEQSWEALLHFHPQLTAHFSRLAQVDPVMAKEYKTLLTELVAERVMAKVVKRVSKEAEGKEAEGKEVQIKTDKMAKLGPRRLKESNK